MTADRSEHVTLPHRLRRWLTQELMDVDDALWHDLADGADALEDNGKAAKQWYLAEQRIKELEAERDQAHSDVELARDVGDEYARTLTARLQAAERVVEAVSKFLDTDRDDASALFDTLAAYDSQKEGG